MNLPLISKLTLVHMLTQDATIQGLTEWTTGVYKVFKDDAHPKAELPYIVVSHYAGGLDERDRIHTGGGIDRARVNNRLERDRHILRSFTTNGITWHELISY